MNRPSWMVIAALWAIVASCPASAQIVIDGTDADDHGWASTYPLANQNGWKYMQRVLENMAPQVRNGNRILVSLGTRPNGYGSGAGAAIASAFGLATLPISDSAAKTPGTPWTLVEIKGVSEIGRYLNGETVNGASLTTMGILHITTAGNAYDDLTDAELSVINANSDAVKGFVHGGGGLFAMAESPYYAEPYGWLTAVIPGIDIVDVSSGGIGSQISLTADGMTAFPDLTNSDISSGPWHNCFSGSFGSLKVLGTSSYAGADRVLILGGGGGTPLNHSPEPGAMTLGLACAMLITGGVLFRRRIGR